jgi:hypothetical protein
MTNPWLEAARRLVETSPEMVGPASILQPGKTLDPLADWQKALVVRVLASAMQKVYEASLSELREHHAYCSFSGQDAPCKCGYRRPFPEEVCERLKEK